MIRDGRLEIKIKNDLDLNVVARELTELGCLLPVNWKRLSTPFSFLGMEFKICYNNGNWGLNKYRKYATFSRAWNAEDKFSIEGTLVIEFKELGLAILDMREGIPGRKADVNAAIFKKEMTATFISAKLNEKFGAQFQVRTSNQSKHKTTVTFSLEAVIYELIINITDVQNFIHTDMEDLSIQLCINGRSVSSFVVKDFLSDFDNIHALVIHKVGVKMKMETKLDKYKKIRSFMHDRIGDVEKHIRSLCDQIARMSITNLSFGHEFKKDLEIFKCLQDK